MRIQKNIRRLNKVVIILLLPVIIFLFLAGWSLHYTASKTQRENQPARLEEVETMMAIFLEEQLERAH